jgi:hypothetical protein
MNVKKIVSLSLVVALVAIILVAIPPVYVKVIKGTNIGSRGSVKAAGVAVYWDHSCANEVTFLDWNALDAGASDVRTIYIKNVGNAAAVLSLETTNWDPASASNFISLTWDYAGQSIAPDAVVEATLTLTISSSITGITDFSFNILIANVS